MKRHIGESLWYLVQAAGVQYTFLFLLLLIWFRVLLIVVDAALRSCKGHLHPLVHPLPSTRLPADPAEIAAVASAHRPEESGPVEEHRASA